MLPHLLQRICAPSPAILAFLILPVLSYVPTIAPAQTVIASQGRAINLFAGEGKLVKLDTPVETVFLADPSVADIEMKSPSLLYIYGKTMGETTLFAIGAGEEVALSSSIEVTLNMDALQSAAKAAVRGNRYAVSQVGRAVVLNGNVETIGDAQRLEDVVKSLAGESVQVVNGLSLDTPAQINLQVKIAEVSRTIAEGLGVTWSTLSGNGLNGGTGINGGYALATSLREGSFQASVTLEALKEEGLASILSEPNLTSRSGDKASFLAGGRFPYRIIDEDGRESVQFEPYGVELEFLPEVQRADQIKLNVRTSIRELDFSSGAEDRPQILERSASTTIEVGSGQSFAIAGLFKATSQQEVEKVPGLGDVPVLGALFRSTRYQKGETELVIIVTPYIVEPTSPKKMKTPLDDFATTNSIQRNIMGELSLGVPVGKDGSVSVNSINGKAGFLLQ
ncbi:type II and III secretion system protein family protein [Tritonibacter mobilis]|uniref:type II and III secretion system protein family protein n=1 Tax=Tritonibacter mobilis TaxID=379347 RepID=UPI0014033F48|nr:type II and III secretion system protein family protein [Tritonibacter mobilis]NHM20556.1 type II and III secretion system protein family protein [Tritonibacter mobilis]NHM24718.1 type II and III secretion system protein family protein [Tritonibacter mobilis]